MDNVEGNMGKNRPFGFKSMIQKHNEYFIKNISFPHSRAKNPLTFDITAVTIHSQEHAAAVNSV